MGRNKGDKNKRPSKRDLTKVSLIQVYTAMKFLQKVIKKDQLSNEQKIELSQIYEQMTNVLKSGERHLNKASI